MPDLLWPTPNTKFGMMIGGSSLNTSKMRSWLHNKSCVQAEKIVEEALQGKQYNRHLVKFYAITLCKLITEA